MQDRKAIFDGDTGPNTGDMQRRILPSGIDHPKCQFWAFPLSMQDCKAIFDGDTGPNTGDMQRRNSPQRHRSPQMSVMGFSVVHAGPQSHI